MIATDKSSIELRLYRTERWGLTLPEMCMGLSPFCRTASRTALGVWDDEGNCDKKQAADVVSHLEAALAAWGVVLWEKPWHRSHTPTTVTNRSDAVYFLVKETVRWWRGMETEDTVVASVGG